MSAKSSSKTVLKIVAFIMIFIGIIPFLSGLGVILFIGKPMVDQAKASENWPTTEGMILESEVRDGQGEESNMFSAHILYEYTVNNQTMEGDRIWFGGDFHSTNREQFQRIVNDYPLGKDVKVYYDPDDPVVAVLQPGAFNSSYIVYIIGCVIMGFGGIFILAAIILLFFSRSKKQDDEFQQDYPDTELA